MKMLIVHRDSYMRDLLEDCAKALFETPGLEVDMCASLAEANDELRRDEPPALLVVGTLLSDGSEADALALVQGTRRRWQAGKAIPAVLIAPTFTATLGRALRDMPELSVVCEGSRVERDFVYALNWRLPGHVRLRAGTGIAEPRPRYTLILRIGADGLCSCRVKSSDVKVARPEDPRPFSVNRTQLQDILGRVPPGPEEADWNEAVKQIGAELVMLLIHGQAPVMQELYTVKGLALADEDIELGLCFEVDQALYPIPFEALKASDFRTDHRYWLQDALLWRSIPGCPASGRPLFRRARPDDRPINCLLIDAGCGGTVSLPNPQAPSQRHIVELRPLTQIEGELDVIQAELMSSGINGIGRIRRVCIRKGAVHTIDTHAGQPDQEHRELGSFDEVLLRILQDEGPWDMVHFAGHSCFVGPAGQEIGYLFLPQQVGRGEDTVPKAIGVASVARLLKDARFVYLSGCSSAHWKVVYDLCAHRVPAMAGYRWSIHDQSAQRCAKSFYHHLLRSRCIERAMQSSWNDSYGNARDDWAWASAQFVIQG
jgi:hypothetical protein